MANDIDPNNWSDRLAKSVGLTVKRIREAREPKMTVQQLSDRLAEIGHPIKRTVLTNLETGRRAYLSLADVLALSYALEVPPIQLISPLDGGRAELLPSASMDPWLASDWLIGLRTQALREAGLPAPWSSWSASMHIYFLRWAYEQQLSVARRAAMVLARDPNEERARIHELEDEKLARIADALRGRGITIPTLRHPVGFSAAGEGPDE